MYRTDAFVATCFDVILLTQGGSKMYIGIGAVLVIVVLFLLLR